MVNSRQGSDLKRRIIGTIIKSADENSLKSTLGKGRWEASGSYQPLRSMVFKSKMAWKLKKAKDRMYFSVPFLPQGGKHLPFSHRIALTHLVNIHEMLG